MKRSFTTRCPSPPQVWYQKEAAFIQENQMGAKFFGLYEATCSVSSSRSPSHPFAVLCALVFGNSIPSPLISSKHGKDDSEFGSASLSLQQHVSASIDLENSLLSKPHLKVFSQASPFVNLITSAGVQVSALVAIPLALPSDMHGPTILLSLARRLTLLLQLDRSRLPQANLLLEAFYNPTAEVSILFSYFYINMFAYLCRIFLQRSIRLWLTAQSRHCTDQISGLHSFLQKVGPKAHLAAEI